jgi:hypothetical protein
MIDIKAYFYDFFLDLWHPFKLSICLTEYKLTESNGKLVWKKCGYFQDLDFTYNQANGKILGPEMSLFQVFSKHADEQPFYPSQLKCPKFWLIFSTLCIPFAFIAIFLLGVFSIICTFGAILLKREI